jgi:tagatose-1,6-bisphosphate aldolase
MGRDGTGRMGGVVDASVKVSEAIRGLSRSSGVDFSKIEIPVDKGEGQEKDC